MDAFTVEKVSNQVLDKVHTLTSTTGNCPSHQESRTSGHLNIRHTQQCLISRPVRRAQRRDVALHRGSKLRQLRHAWYAPKAANTSRSAADHKHRDEALHLLLSRTLRNPTLQNSIDATHLRTCLDSVQSIVCIKYGLGNGVVATGVVAEHVPFLSFDPASNTFHSTLVTSE